MLDFTSALYLGLSHPSSSLRPWARFTMGVPAAVNSPPDAQALAQSLARLQGCERGSLGTSTLHLFWDLFGMLADRPVEVYLDDGAYPIARWGVERAAARGVPVHTFSHHNPAALQRRMKENAHARRLPCVVADGFCPGCGKSAPLATYLDCARASDGCLIFDDTQALGIFGYSPGPRAPYGRGGGGSLPRIQIRGADVLVVSSLAKAFGSPVAVLAGSNAVVEGFESNSKTRVHCSPPSIAVMRAVEHALAINNQHGDALRLRLAHLVARFRQHAAQAGFNFSGGLFPVQMLLPSANVDAVALHERLLELGIRTVLLGSRDGGGARLGFIVTARHTPGDIDFAVTGLSTALRPIRNRATSPGLKSHSQRMCASS